jgi:Iron/manganese superoxide dismutases, alpha-hairpin domain
LSIGRNLIYKSMKMQQAREIVAQQHGLPKLPYAINGLEPYISSESFNSLHDGVANNKFGAWARRYGHMLYRDARHEVVALQPRYMCVVA